MCHPQNCSWIVDVTRWHADRPRAGLAFLRGLGLCLRLKLLLSLRQGLLLLGGLLSDSEELLLLLQFELLLE